MSRKELEYCYWFSLVIMMFATFFKDWSPAFTAMFAAAYFYDRKKQQAREYEKGE